MLGGARVSTCEVWGDTDIQSLAEGGHKTQPCVSLTSHSNCGRGGDWLREVECYLGAGLGCADASPVPSQGQGVASSERTGTPFQLRAAKISHCCDQGSVGRALGGVPGKALAGPAQDSSLPVLGTGRPE